MHLRLTAAVDTSSRTAHDLNKMIVRLFSSYFIHDNLRIGKSGSNGDFHIHSCYVVNRFFDSLCSTNFCKFYFLKCLACQFFHCGTKSRFHNASCCAEDHSRSCRFSERIVESFIRKTAEINSDFTDQACKFPCRDRNIYIRNAACVLIFSLDFKLLRRTRHHADADNIFRRNVHLFRIICFRNRSEHLLR